MSIGGHDVVLPFAWEAEDRDRIVRFFRQTWQQGVYEDALGDYSGSLRESLRSAPPSREFFIYASQEASCSWESHGACETTLDAMVYVIGREDGVTLVVGRAHGPLEGLLEELRSFLVQERIRTGEGRRAA